MVAKLKLHSLRILALFFILSCQEENETKRKHEFQLKFNSALFHQNNVQGKINNTADVDALYISLEDESGNPVTSLQKLNLLQQQSNGVTYYITESILLEEGNYQITFLALVDDADNILYAVPIEGSEFANLVTDPLPIHFNVNGLATTSLEPELLNTNNVNPAQLGYASFQLNIPVIETYSLTITTDVSNVERFAMAEVLVTKGDEVFTQTMTVNGNTASATFNNLTEGEWTYSVKVNSNFEEEYYNNQQEAYYAEEHQRLDFETLRYRASVQLQVDQSIQTPNILDNSWIHLQSERASNATYFFFHPTDLGKVEIEIPFNLSDTPSRPDLDIISEPGKHAWDFLLIFNASEVIANASCSDYSFGTELENEVSKVFCFNENLNCQLFGNEKFISLDISEINKQLLQQFQNFSLYMIISVFRTHQVATLREHYQMHISKFKAENCNTPLIVPVDLLN